MGNTLSDIHSNSAGEEAKAREQVDILVKLAAARLDTFEAELKQMPLDNDSATKMSLPGRRALRFERDFRFDTGSPGSPGVDQAVDAFLGIGDAGAGRTEDALEGFKLVVKNAMKHILSDTSAGESYDKKFFVCIKHNSIIRVDVYTYRYNFTNEGVISTHKNILAYILCISVVHPDDLTVDEIVHLASEYAGDEQAQFKAYVNSLIQARKETEALRIW